MDQSDLNPPLTLDPLVQRAHDTARVITVMAIEHRSDAYRTP